MDRNGVHSEKRPTAREEDCKTVLPSNDADLYKSYAPISLYFAADRVDSKFQGVGRTQGEQVWKILDQVS